MSLSRAAAAFAVMAAAAAPNASAQEPQVTVPAVQGTLLSVSAEGLSLIVDASVSDAPVRDIVAAMEEAPHLCDALPEIAGAGRFEIRANVASAETACGAEAATP